MLIKYNMLNINTVEFHIFLFSIFSLASLGHSNIIQIFTLLSQQSNQSILVENVTYTG